MASVYLIRHGKAVSTWGQRVDPALDPVGLDQAAKAAEQFAGNVKTSMRIVSSPMRRARQTADALAQLWRIPMFIWDAVSEIPSPRLSMEQRMPWLLSVMRSDWSNLDEELLHWRERLLAALADCREDTVIFSHYVAINAVVGALEGSDKVTVFNPDYCSVTVLNVTPQKLMLLEKGVESKTEIL